MSVSASIITKSTGITSRLTKMIENVQSTQMTTFLNRYAYKIYQNYQRDRWANENSAEGGWPALSPKYAAYKPRRYGGGKKRDGGVWPSYPGGGRKMMIATGRLVTSVVGVDMGASVGLDEHRKLVSGNTLTVSTAVPYASEAGATRDFMTFTPAFYADIRLSLKEFILASNQTLENL